VQFKLLLWIALEGVEKCGFVIVCDLGSLSLAVTVHDLAG
jgi:hypothetical protein